jgi:hypothetical protein
MSTVAATTLQFAWESPPLRLGSFLSSLCYGVSLSLVSPAVIIYYNVRTHSNK